MDRKGIYDLPTELFLIIFDSINLYELKGMRLVSPRFRDCIDYLLVNELIVYNNYNEDLANCWSFTYKPINPKYCLHLNLRRRFFECPLFMFKTLKSLKINSVISKNIFNFSDLNQFHSLVHLDAKICSMKTDNELLNLPNLRYFSLISYELFSIEVHCPKLEYFKYNQVLSSMKFDDRSSIKHLEIVDYSEEIGLFRNLEVLHLIRCYQLDINILKLLPSLKELYLNCTSAKRDRQNFENFYFQIESIVEYVDMQRVNLQRSDVKIYIFGVEYDSRKTFDEYNFKQAEWKLHLQNYSSLSPVLPWFTHLNYNECIQIAKNSLPADFFSRYINIQKLKNVGRIVNQNIFIEFLMCCRNLGDLELVYCNLTPTFYHQLSFICPALNKLKIKEGVKVEINMNYIYELKLLRNLETDQVHKMEQMLGGFRKLHFLKKIVFHSNRNNQIKVNWIDKLDSDLVLIMRNDNGHFYLNFREQLTVKPFKVTYPNITYDQLTDVCRKLENREV